MQDIDPLIPLPALGPRFGGRSNRTFYRWIKKGILPKPTNINGRLYFRNSQLEETDRKLGGRAAS